MLGFKKEPVEFRIKKPVMGIGRSRYPDGILSTKSVKEIAMLRHLPDNHVEEIVEVEEGEDLSDLPWEVLMQRSRKAEVYKVGMTRDEVVEALQGAPV